MAIDLVKEFAKYEKTIVKYVHTRIDYYDKSKCKEQLKRRVARLNSSWDMVVSGKNSGTNQQLKGQMSYGLVKQQQLARRSLFSGNFRGDPLFTPRAIGNTPLQNALNMKDILQSNVEQTHFRPLVLMPCNSGVAKIGSAVVFTEYCNNRQLGWRTVADPLTTSKRVYGVIKNTHNAVTYPINVLNYGQNPDVVDCEQSDYNYHIERWRLSELVNRIKSNSNLYIKENIEKIIGDAKKSNNLSEYYHDSTGKQTAHDYGAVTVNDVIRGQFQINIDGNEDDNTVYYLEMIGDTIIRFQDNPYDMNMKCYTTICCERRDEYWWGNTPAEYSIGNENLLNLLLGLSTDNVIESMKKYIFFQKDAISPQAWMQSGSQMKIPVDVDKMTNMQNIFYTYQVPDTSSGLIKDVYSRTLANDQLFSASPNFNRPQDQGGPVNTTATAVNAEENKNNMLDSDILERLSFDWARVGEKQMIILSQFLGNFGPILVKPSQAEALRYIQKENLVGNYSTYMDTALQQTQQGELIRYQNMASWLLNLVNGGARISPNIAPIVEQVIKMGKFIVKEDILQREDMEQVPTMPVPGMEMAGAAQETAPQGQGVAA